VKCDALLHDFCCFNMLSADTCEKYARFSLEKLTERLEGIICPLPRCGEALLDVPPIAQQKCIRCPYCLKCFCQKCKVEVEVLGMNGDLILANGGNRGDSEEEEGGGSRDVDREVATGGGSKSVQDLSKNFKFLCKSCDLEWVRRIVLSFHRTAGLRCVRMLSTMVVTTACRLGRMQKPKLSSKEVASLAREFGTPRKQRCMRTIYCVLCVQCCVAGFARCQPRITAATLVIISAGA